jgi:hypothetical protein
VATAADVARRHVMCPLTPSVLHGAAGLSAVCHATLKRGGTHLHEVFLGGFDFHFQADSMGTTGETSGKP